MLIDSASQQACMAWALKHLLMVCKTKRLVPIKQCAEGFFNA